MYEAVCGYEADPERFGIGVVTNAAYDEILSSGAGSSEAYTYTYLSYDQQRTDRKDKEDSTGGGFKE